MIVKTSIEPFFKRRLIVRSLFFSLLGSASLLLFLFFSSMAFLEKWGVGIFLFSILMIRKGFSSYRILIKKRKIPDELAITKEAILFSSGGTAHFLLPCRFVKSLTFIEGKKEYGIAISLNLPWQEKIILKNPRFPLKRFHKKAKNKYKADLFFPFFSRSSFDLIKKELSSKSFLKNVMHPDDSHNL